MEIAEIGLLEQGKIGLKGRLYQSGWINAPSFLLSVVPRPFGIISLATPDNSGLSDMLPESTFLYRRPIEDGNQGLLTAHELDAMASMAAMYMRDGVNVLVHCIVGQSRSSYVLAHILCTILDCTGQQALDILVRDRGADRICNMQQCFKDHINQLWPA